jgi:hypothetical protein
VPYLDIELLLVAWLQARFPAVQVCTETPASMGTVLPNGTVIPVIQVVRTSGLPVATTLDGPLVDVDCFALGRAAARSLAYKVMAQLETGLVGATDGTASHITRVRITLGPQWRPYDNTALRRFGVSAYITAHSVNIS